MSLLAGALVVALLVAAGWWPMRRWGRALEPLGAVGRMSLACGLGAAIVGLAQVTLAWLGRPCDLVVPSVVAALSLLLARVDRSRPAAGVPLPRWAAALLLLVGLVSTAAAVGLPFSSDGSKFWGIRARELSVAAARDLPSLHDARQLAFHREYPLLVPALLAPAFGLSPPDASGGAKLVLHALTLAGIGLLASLLAREGAPGRALLIASACLPALVSLEQRESAVAAGFVDGAVGLFLLLAVVGVDALRRREPALPLVALACAALVSTKNEGAMHMALLLIGWLVAGPSRRGLLMVALLAAALALPTWMLRAQVVADPPSSDASQLLDPSALAARAPVALVGVAGKLLDASVFGLLPLLLLVFLTRGLRRDGARAHALPLVLVAGLGAALVLVYLATVMHAGRHVHTSAHRVVLQALPAWTLLVARAANRS